MNSRSLILVSSTTALQCKNRASITNFSDATYLMKAHCCSRSTTADLNQRSSPHLEDTNLQKPQTVSFPEYMIQEVIQEFCHYSPLRDIQALLRLASIEEEADEDSMIKKHTSLKIQHETAIPAQQDPKRIAVMQEPQGPLFSQNSSASFSEDSSVSISEEEARMTGTQYIGEDSEGTSLAGVSESSLEVILRANEVCEFVNEELQFEQGFNLEKGEVEDLKARILEVFQLNNGGYLDLGSMACAFELDVMDDGRSRRLACFNIVAEIYELC